MAINSRNKIVAGLLRNELETGFGLIGSGQDVSIMHSTLVRTCILKETAGEPSLHLKTGNLHLDNLMMIIERFILQARQIKSVSFEVLYHILCSPDNHVGLRRGLIPIYLATVLHEYKQKII
ncbi:MAG: restriction endonuclease subunit S, partial [Eubacterium aggregans]